MRISDHYRPFPRQEQFHTSPAKYRLFGGAAGPGKTKALLWEAIRQANCYAGVDTLLLRRTFPELEGSLLREFRRSVPRDLYRSFNASKNIVTWTNGSTTRFGSCRNENEVYKYQGDEFLFIGIDELTHFTLKQWQFLTSRNRCPVPGTLANMGGASNPGNIGHAWVKALWMDRKLDEHGSTKGFDRPELYDPRDYDFIPAKLTDNPIYANDENYRKTLMALPENLRRAMLEGDWNVFAGQYFDFDLLTHVERAEDLLRKDWWPCWISIDWGFEHPSAVYWHTLTEDKRVITYREDVKNHQTPRQLGERIASLSDKKEKIENVFLSPDAFANRTGEATIAEQLGETLELNELPAPSAATDDRIGGWMQMYQLLEQDRWIISDHCQHLIACLPNLVRDEKKVEDIKKVAGDDPADGARYGLYGVSYIDLGTEPLGDRVTNRLAKTELVVKNVDDQGHETVTIKDMTGYAIHARRIEAEERQKAKPVVRKRFRGSRPW